MRFAARLCWTRSVDGPAGPRPTRRGARHRAGPRLHHPTDPRARPEPGPPGRRSTSSPTPRTGRSRSRSSASGSAGCDAVLCLLNDPIDASVLEAARGLPGLRQHGGRLQQHRRGRGHPAGHPGDQHAGRPDRGDGRPDLGPDPGRRPPGRRGGPRDAGRAGSRAGGRCTCSAATSPAGPSAWSGRAGSPRPSPSGPSGSGCRCSTTAAATSPALDALGARRVGARRAARPRATSSACTSRSTAETRHLIDARALGADEADGLPDQHRAGPGGRRGGAGRGPEGRAGSPARGSTSTRTSRAMAEGLADCRQRRPPAPPRQRDARDPGARCRGSRPRTWSPSSRGGGRPTWSTPRPGAGDAAATAESAPSLRSRRLRPICPETSAPDSESRGEVAWACSSSS